MAMTARRNDACAPPARRAPLRLVTTPPAPKKPAGPSARARALADEARARTAFTIFASVLLFAIVLGGVRVTLIAKAAEVSLSEGGIQVGIKEQRAVADQLEFDRSALSTPSRIANIAASSMSMGEPRSVRYISQSDVSPAPAVGSVAPSDHSLAQASAPLARVLGAVVDLSAGEAQSLLVGDLGLAGSR